MSYRAYIPVFENIILAGFYWLSIIPLCGYSAVNQFSELILLIILYQYLKNCFNILSKSWTYLNYENTLWKTLLALAMSSSPILHGQLDDSTSKFLFGKDCVTHWSK